MTIQTRPYRLADQEQVVSLSIRAWTPVFASMQEVLGDEVFERLHGQDWRVHQADSVRQTLGDPDMTVWVAESRQEVVGFVAACVREPTQRLGEVSMLAVDVRWQRQGIGTALTSLATAWLRDQGMCVAMVETGGDPGHAPARRMYEKADYSLMPIARYFRAL